jgi:hypothetical protein
VVARQREEAAVSNPEVPVGEERSQRRAAILRKKSRHMYGRPKEMVEEAIAARAQFGPKHDLERLSSTSMEEWLARRRAAQATSDSA